MFLYSKTTFMDCLQINANVAACWVLQERSQGLVKQVGLEESKYRSLQLSVDRLNSSQAKNDEEMLAAKNRVC